MSAEPNGQIDGRRVRGDRTRRAAVERAAQIASESGLSGVSFHQIATDLGISKSGVAAAFGTKAEFEVATVAAASATFMEHVVQPAMSKQAGRPRLKAIVDSWFEYASERVFAGGCFMVAVMPEYDTQPGPVRDELLASRAVWRELLAAQVSVMQERGQLDTKLPPDAVAFEIEALLAATVLEMNLTDQASALAMARRVLRVRLGV